VFALVAKLAVVASVVAPGFQRQVDDATVARWAGAGGVEYLLKAAWIEGEAAQRGLTVSDQDVDEATVDPHDGLTRQRDLRYEARINLLTAALKAPQLQAAAEAVTDAQIDAWLQTHPLETPTQRRFRLLAAPSRRKAIELEKALNRGVTWRIAERRFAPGTKDLRRASAPATTRLDKAVFRAQRNRVTRYGRNVFKVIAETPPRPLPDRQRHATAWEILAGEAQATASARFDAALTAKWRPLTACADPASAPSVCGNSPTG
jgi:hypothetical protein